MPNIRSNLSPKCARGYIYDAETQLYYCQSRYYDPALGRFINADNVILLGADSSVLSYNLYVYCNNNPLIYSDSKGDLPNLSDVFISVAKSALVIAGIAAGITIFALTAPAAIAIGSTVISTTAVATAAASIGTQAVAVAGCAAVASLASKKVEKQASQTYSVYFLEDASGIIQYVGRVTDSGYSARMRHHAATRNLTPQLRVSGLSYAEARGLEEIGMIECHTLNASNPKNNQIHGIGSNNKNGERYIRAACNYLSNRAENSLLCLIS